MSKKLSDDDRRAVDLLLDRSGNGQASYATPAGAALHQRLQNAEKLLQVLAAMPAIDPAPDLVARTMRRIEERSHEPAVSPVISDLAGDSRPLA
jgi:hypothetical protein